MSPSSRSMSPHSFDSEDNVVSMYRQSEYRDGPVVRIHETRRSGMVVDRRETPTTLRRRNRLSDLKDDRGSQKEIRATYLSKHEENNPRNGPLCLPTSNRHHVTVSSRKLEPRSAILMRKAVVIHHKSNDSTDTGAEGWCRTSHPSRPLTPPATPKFQRLPTPDLVDLDTSAFCDCCVERMKHCPTCSCAMVRDQ